MKEDNVIILAEFIETRKEIVTLNKDEFTYFDLKKDKIMLRRFSAFAADFFIVLTIFNVISVSYVTFLNTFLVPLSDAQRLSFTTSTIGMSIAIFAVVYLTYFLAANYLYEGQTFGKKWMGLKVINEAYIYFDEVYEYNLTFSQALRRSMGKFLCYASFCSFFILNFINEEKRGIPDMVSKSRVVSEEWFVGFKANKLFDKESVKIDINSLERAA